MKNHPPVNPGWFSFEVSTSLDVLLAGVGGQSAGAQTAPLGSYTTLHAAEADGTVTVTVKSTLVQGGVPSGAVTGTLTADAPAAGTARYDLISLDRATGAAVLTQGTDRATDAMHFRPAQPAGHATLAYLRHSMSAVPAYSFVPVPVPVPVPVGHHERHRWQRRSARVDDAWVVGDLRPGGDRAGDERARRYRHRGAADPHGGAAQQH